MTWSTEKARTSVVHFNSKAITSSKSYFNKSFGQLKFLPTPRIRTGLTCIFSDIILLSSEINPFPPLCLKNHLSVFLMCLILMNYYVICCPFSCERAPERSSTEGSRTPSVSTERALKSYLLIISWYLLLLKSTHGL